MANRATRRRLSILLGSLVGLVATVGTAQAVHLTPETAGHTTLEQVIAPNSPGSTFTTLTTEQVNEDFVLRDGSTEAAGSPGSGAPVAQPGRETRRRSLVYFGDVSDGHVADEESPARVWSSSTPGRAPHGGRGRR